MTRRELTPLSRGLETGSVPMRLLLPLAAGLFLAGCSDAPTESKAKAPEKPSAPITGRQAFQMTFAAASGWAADSLPLRLASMNLVALSIEAGTWRVRM